tara:strand:- start:5786 stop:6406 length:621 start_codon:yes stop_codon:yes gene_type:complete
MKQTTIKISVTQDGLLPEEVTLLGKIFIPSIQKQILKSTGFEKIDDSTYAGVMPVKIIANAKVQEIEFEIGAIPDFRKKVVEFVNVVSLQDFIEPEPEPVVETKKKSTKSKKEKNQKKEAVKPKKKVVGTSPLKSKAKKASAKKAVAKKSTAKKAVAKKSTGKKAVAKKSTAKKTIPKKVAQKKVASKKSSKKTSKVPKVNKTKRK